MFSVIIPLYNKRFSIAATLQSVLGQSFSDFEVIVVDDGSTDGSGQVVKQFSDKRIRLIEKKNGGVSSARNTGIQAAKFQHVALLDGDDLWNPAYLDEQYKLIHDFPKAKMWSVNYAVKKGERIIPCEQGWGEGFRGYVNGYFERTNHNDLFFSSGVVIDKMVFEQVGFFDERIALSEDLDMWYRIILHYPVVYNDNVLVIYNQNAENRVAYDTGIHFPLPKDFMYYIDKFQADFENNPYFSSFLNTYVASGLLNKGYYFGNNQDRHDAGIVASKLRYNDIHPKYKWIFKTPRWIGWLVYRIVLLKKRIRIIISH